MALDGIFIHLLKNELAQKCCGGKVDKIFQPAKDELLLLLRGKDLGGKLLISARPAAARIQLTSSAPENPAVPPMFCMLLRKKLLGAVLKEIQQYDLDRVIKLIFLGKNELGDSVSYSLIAEFIGRQPNIILLDNEDKIIDAIYRSSVEAERLVMPGALYERPKFSPKRNIIKHSIADIIFAVTSCHCELSKAIRDTLDGVSPLVSREIALKVTTEPILADSLEERLIIRLKVYLESLAERINQGGKPHILLNPNGEPFDFSYLDILQYGTSSINRIYPGYSELLDEFYSEKEKAQRIKNNSRDVLRVLTSAAERISKKINLRKAEMEKCLNRDELRINGELIKANLHSLKRGDSVCKAMNYYEPDCPEINIKLNPSLSPAENAQRYFKLYRKAHTAAQLLTKLIEEGEAELNYIETVFDALSRAENDRDIEEIRQELTISGYIKTKQKDKKKKVQLSSPIKREISDGFTVLIGRNNRQNDELTMKIADSNDIWLHTKNVPGSHVIVKTGGRPLTDSALNEAAKLAVIHSSVKDSGTAEVDYTQVKFVKKPPGSKPGMVIYDKFKSIFVRI